MTTRINGTPVEVIHAGDTYSAVRYLAPDYTYGIAEGSELMVRNSDIERAESVSTALGEFFDNLSDDDAALIDEGPAGTCPQSVSGLPDGTYTMRPAGHALTVNWATGYQVGIRAMDRNPLPGETFGIWREDGVTYADFSEHVSDFNDALNLARERGEIAIWDWEAGEAINVESCTGQHSTLDELFECDECAELLDEDEDETMSESDALKRFNEYLDDAYPEIVIAGMSWSASYALEELDPNGYRSIFLDWADAEGIEFD